MLRAVCVVLPRLTTLCAHMICSGWTQRRRADAADTGSQARTLRIGMNAHTRSASTASVARVSDILFMRSCIT